MKIVFLGMDGRFSTRPLETLARRHQLVGVVESPRLVREVLLLRWLTSGKMAGNLKLYADHYGAAHLKVKGARDPKLLEFLRDLSPDLGCISNFSFLLPREVLNVPRLGIINLHPSLLPQYRGPYPWLWMFYHGDALGGWTVHQADPGEDTGPILAQTEFEVPRGVTATELADAVLPPGAELLAEVVDQLAAGTARPRPQVARDGLVRARAVGPREELVEWGRWPAQRTYHFVRGASLWYDPLVRLPGWRRDFCRLEKAVPELAPGLVGRDPGGRFVACRDGKIYFVYRPEPKELFRLALVSAAAAALAWAVAPFLRETVEPA